MTPSFEDLYQLFHLSKQRLPFNLMCSTSTFCVEDWCPYGAYGMNKMLSQWTLGVVLALQFLASLGLM